MEPRARFDDCTPGSEHSFALWGLERTILARRHEDVLPALTQVEDAVANGSWAAGFVAYEAAPAFDRALIVRAFDTHDAFCQLPLVWFGIFAYRQEVAPLVPRRASAPYQVSAWRAELDRSAYDEAIAAIREHIAAGDTYQVNHTFRLRAAFSGDPDELYRDLVLAQRGAHSASLDTGRYRVLSASPERFLRVDGDRIEVRPMKGTIRRGRWSGEDDEMAARLLTSEKERAENLIIVDLLRNDLGRVARFGTVHVDDLLALERYETLWQLTSTISARLTPEATLSDVFTALFPPGSVTGAPKARTMEIISELERSPRGVYCGAIGFVAPRGVVADFSVAIRTVVIDAVEGIAEYGVGGGITWDSSAEAEFEEARLKAQLLVERRPDFELLETLRWESESGFVLLEEHLARLARSALYFGFSVRTELVVEALEKAVAGYLDPLRVRLTVGRDGSVSTSSTVADEPFLGLPGHGAALRVAVSTEPIATSDVFLFHKTTNRAAYDRRLRPHADVDDVLLVNDRGEVTESTIGNVAVRLGDRWWTPPVDAGCLGGTYRAALLRDGVLGERPISVGEVATADEVAVINSVRGWRVVTLVG